MSKKFTVDTGKRIHTEIFVKNFLEIPEGLRNYHCGFSRDYAILTDNSMVVSFYNDSENDSRIIADFITDLEELGYVKVSMEDYRK